jgi:hypothetical protein
MGAPARVPAFSITFGRRPFAALLGHNALMRMWLVAGLMMAVTAAAPVPAAVAEPCGPALLAGTEYAGCFRVETPVVSPGDTIVVTGRVDEPKSWRYFARNPGFAVDHRSPACDLHFLRSESSLTLDEQTRRIRLTVTVPTTGTCAHQDADPVPLVSGTYRVNFPCHQCGWLPVHVSAADTLPFTGAPPVTRQAALVAVLLLVAGIGLTRAGRRRRT